jgi:hypothetical protein
MMVIDGNVVVAIEATGMMMAVRGVFKLVLTMMVPRSSE